MFRVSGKKKVLKDVEKMSAYSKEKGTVSGGKTGQVPEKLKAERLKVIMKL